MKNRIREKRIEKGLNQNELAEKANLSSRQLSDIELDKADFKISTLINIAAALETTVGYLIYENEEKRPNNIAVLDGQGN